MVGGMVLLGEGWGFFSRFSLNKDREAMGAGALSPKLATTAGRDDNI